MNTFKQNRTVKPDDIDMLGHVNNAVWVDYIADLSSAHASSRGLGMRALREKGAVWIVRRHEIDYHASALPGEELVGETWVEQMKGARSIRCCRFTRASDGALLVESRTTWAYVDAETQRPRRIPAEILGSFG